MRYKIVARNIQKATVENYPGGGFGYSHTETFPEGTEIRVIRDCNGYNFDLLRETLESYCGNKVLSFTNGWVWVPLDR